MGERASCVGGMAYGKDLYVKQGQPGGSETIHNIWLDLDREIEVIRPSCGFIDREGGCMVA